MPLRTKKPPKTARPTRNNARITGLRPVPVHASFRRVQTGWKGETAGWADRTGCPAYPAQSLRASDSERTLDVRRVMTAMPRVHRDRLVDGHAPPLLVGEHLAEVAVGKGTKQDDPAL